METADEQAYKISSRYLQKWLLWQKLIKTGIFHVISGLNRDFSIF